MSSRFITRLCLEDGEGENPLCTLLSAFVYDSDVLKARVTVPEGFQTDLASVPRLPVVYLLTGATGNEAAVIHDFLYTSQPCTRKQADDTFHEALLASGVPGWRAWMMWCGVRAGGASHWTKRPARRQEQTG